MRKRIGVIALVVAVCGVLAGTAAASAGPSTAATTTAAAAAPYCGITWGSLPKAAGQHGAASLISTRTGRHECWDRIVFEFNGPATGYAVQYGEVSDDGEGLVFNPYTAGGAHLKVQLRASAYDDYYRPTYPYRNGDHPHNVLRYSTLRDVLYGGSYEGYTTFAVGVRGQLPYRVFTLSGPGTHSRIVIDIAHRW